MSATTHSGSCQCGAVAFEAEVDVSTPIVCNCSRCRRIGSRLAFTTPENFRLLRGEEALTEYLFNRQTVRHLFCRVCGVESFAFGRAPDGREMVAVNVNALEDVDVFALPTHFHDGKSA